ncbi:MAG: insulinase family protein [Synoicihabitans sp.]
MGLGRQILGGILWTTLTCVAIGAKDWPIGGEGIEVDPAIRWGELDNGLRYAIKRQPHPVGSISLRMVVFAGSLHEEPDEVGIAHFVEHMAFNGTNKFRKETLGPKLEAAGIRFGPELTAFTYPSYTIYQMDLPSATDEKLDLGITVLREWASEIRFARQQVQREKGVIRSEHLSRGENAIQMYIKRLEFLYPDSLLSQRPPVTHADQINSVTPARLKTFYRKWYRPDNTLIVATGDFDPADIETRLRATFEDWIKPNHALPVLDLGEITNKPQPRAHLVPNETVKTFVAELALVRPRRIADSWEDRRHRIALALGLSALNERLMTIQRDNPGKYGNLSVRLSSPTPYSQELSLVAEGRTVEWQDIIEVVIDEYRRLMKHGFQEEELEKFRINRLAGAKRSLSTGVTEKSEHLAHRYTQMIMRGITPTTPEFNLNLEQSVTPSITAEECLQAIKAFARSGFPGLLVSSESLPRLSVDEVTEAINRTLQNPVLPPVLAESVAFPYTDFGPGGDIVHRAHDEPLDVHMVEFDNGVKLNLKRTNFDEGSVFLTMRMDNGGRLRQPKRKPALASIASGAYFSGGLEKIRWQELQTALAGRFVNFQFSVSENAFNFRGRAQNSDLKLLLQVLTAYVVEPAVEDFAVTTAFEQVRSWYAAATFDTNRAVNVHSGDVFFQGDPRFGAPDWPKVETITPDDVRAWLKQGLAEGDIEVGLVGDMDIETAIAATADTLGTLPPRIPATPFPNPRILHQGKTAKYSVETPEKKSTLVVAWPAGGFATARGRRTLEILSWIVRARVNEEIRETLGMTYSPSTNRWSTESYPDLGYFQITFNVDHDHVDRVYKQVSRITEDLAKGHITESELTRAREPLLQGVKRQLNTNGYWIQYVTSKAQTDPEALIMPHTRQTDLETIGIAEIKKIARDILQAERQIIIYATPNHKIQE